MVGVCTEALTNGTAPCYHLINSNTQGVWRRIGQPIGDATKSNLGEIGGASIVRAFIFWVILSKKTSSIPVQEK